MSDPVGACACIGPQNGEPFCPCRMKQAWAGCPTPEKLRGLAWSLDQRLSGYEEAEAAVEALRAAADEIEALKSTVRRASKWWIE